MRHLRRQCRWCSRANSKRDVSRYLRREPVEFGEAELDRRSYLVVASDLRCGGRLSVLCLIFVGDSMSASPQMTSSSPSPRAAAVCPACSGTGSTVAALCLWCTWGTVVVPNPAIDAAAMRFAVEDSTASIHEQIRRYFAVQRSLPMLAVVNPSWSTAQAASLRHLTSPMGQAGLLCHIKHEPGTLVARPSQNVIVVETGSWRRAVGRNPDFRRVWLARECILSAPAIDP